MKILKKCKKDTKSDLRKCSKLCKSRLTFAIFYLLRKVIRDSGEFPKKIVMEELDFLSEEWA